MGEYCEIVVVFYLLFLFVTKRGNIERKLYRVNICAFCAGNKTGEGRRFKIPREKRVKGDLKETQPSTQDIPESGCVLQFSLIPVYFSETIFVLTGQINLSIGQRFG